ncbi:THAP domain-containing protein 1-like [Malaya genurostris]|uniref:THAP domain-containing protein 1-like n=1 Tax=Malaya genurostris TaxID=325434 RepID=UPI0026F3BCB5|nr:THAP domain-containing protein 1-like [Malaya genurostris]
MSKRCCAASCYNSIATNRDVEYFGFPKSAEYATAWAKAAGREDLLEKSLNNIIKYFLCSEHFTDECFQDHPMNRKLKKSSRPVMVPIPTIFQNNFNECVSKLLKEEHCSLPTSSFERRGKDSHEHTIKELAVDDPIQVCAELEEPLFVTTVDDFIVGNNLATKKEITSQENMLTFVDTIAELQGKYDSVIIELMNCRLCLTAKTNDQLIPIYNDGKDIAHILERIMPDTIKPNDGFPQQICLACLEAATQCINTIEKFKAIQNKLKVL